MKKLLSLLFISVFAFTLIGCGDGGTNEVQSSDPKGSNASEEIKDSKDANKGMATPAEAGTE
jgi:uncharacterized lipoprotein YehR (DUF1307 family)